MRTFWALLLTAVVTAGCAVPQPQGTPVWQRHRTNPITGTGYYIYVPSTYRHTKPAPLIVTCHGSPPFDVSEHHIRAWKWLAEEEGCIVVAPALTATDGVLGDGPVIGMLENERRILCLISWLGYRYNLDLANMMITGFSGGGFPTYWVGLRHPELFSAVVGRSCNFSERNLTGWYPPDAVNTNVMIYIGENDPSAIRAQSLHGMQYLRDKGFPVAWLEIPGIGHQRRPEFAMDFFKRTWSAPRPSLPTR